MPYDPFIKNKKLVTCVRIGGRMFEKVDLTKKIDDASFEKSISPLKERLSVLQRTLRDLNIPIIIVIEGWNTAGITMSTGEIIQSLDPRGFTLHAIDKATDVDVHIRSCGDSGLKPLKMDG
jgi:polyphosphate kinase 2 (PPK2 family)